MEASAVTPVPSYQLGDDLGLNGTQGRIHAGFVVSGALALAADRPGSRESSGGGGKRGPNHALETKQKFVATARNERCDARRSAVGVISS